MPIDLSIRNIIKEKGYIKIDEMMRQVLCDNNKSYYKTIGNIGFEGDFTTSPEVSQLFGEMIALWAIDQWTKLNKPNPFCLVELGPGQGQLMADLLRTANIMPEFLSSVQIYLHDINPNFIKKQKDKLKSYSNVKWIDNLEQIPDLPAIIFSNEFFDAMPIKQYMKVKDKWKEAVLVTDPNEDKIKHDNIDIHKILQEQFQFDHKDAPDGSILEESVDSLNIMRLLSNKIKKNTGCILTIDYGYNISMNDRTSKQYNSTLQAVKEHKYVSIIDTLGESDLTAHVDFNALKNAAKEQGGFDYNYQTQRQFLLAHGIEIRAAMLKQNLSPSDAKIIDRQLERLISHKMMGELFKVLEVRHI